VRRRFFRVIENQAPRVALHTISPGTAADEF
jgi:hypothetical protein